MLLVAQAHVVVSPALSIELLKYVVAATDTKFGAAVNLKANTLLSSLCEWQSLTHLKEC